MTLESENYQIKITQENLNTAEKQVKFIALTVALKKINDQLAQKFDQAIVNYRSNKNSNINLSAEQLNCLLEQFLQDTKFKKIWINLGLKVVNLIDNQSNKF